MRVAQVREEVARRAQPDAGHGTCQCTIGAWLALLIIIQVEARVATGTVSRVVTDSAVERALKAHHRGTHVIFKFTRSAVLVRESTALSAGVVAGQAAPITR